MKSLLEKFMPIEGNEIAILYLINSCKLYFRHLKTVNFLKTENCLTRTPYPRGIDGKHNQKDSKNNLNEPLKKWKKSKQNGEKCLKMRVSIKSVFQQKKTSSFQKSDKLLFLLLSWKPSFFLNFALQNGIFCSGVHLIKTTTIYFFAGVKQLSKLAFRM